MFSVRSSLLRYSSGIHKGIMEYISFVHCIDNGNTLVRKCESNDQNRKVCVREDFSPSRNCQQKRAKQKTNYNEWFSTTCDGHFDKQKQKKPFVKDFLAKSGSFLNLSSYSILEFTENLVNSVPLLPSTSLTKQKSPNPTTSRCRTRTLVRDQGLEPWTP